MRGDFEAHSAPASQTLIVLSDDPETILLPSDENDTEKMPELWALLFLVLRSSVAARQANKRQI